MTTPPTSGEFAEPPLTGHWRHGHGSICCGTLRIARSDFDTNPSPEFQRDVLDWMCNTLNEKIASPQIAQLEKELADTKLELEMVRNSAREAFDSAQTVETYEQWLRDIGQAIGCKHLDEQLPNCVIRELQKEQPAEPRYTLAGAIDTILDGLRLEWVATTDSRLHAACGSTYRIFEHEDGGCIVSTPSGNTNCDSVRIGKHLCLEAWWAGSDDDAHMVYSGDPIQAVADCGRDDGDYGAEEANARLIAAAPELLEALSPFAQFACDTPHVNEPECQNCKACAAIAKALGETT